MIRRWIWSLLCEHYWLETRRLWYPGEGDLICERCVMCRTRRWRMA